MDENNSAPKETMSDEIHVQKESATTTPASTPEKTAAATSANEHSPASTSTTTNSTSSGASDVKEHQSTSHHTSTKKSSAETTTPPYSSSDSSPNLWKVVSVLSIILLIVSIFTGGFSFGEADSSSVQPISSQEATSRVLEFVNTQLLQQGVTASATAVNELNGLYAVDLDILGQELTSYITLDGKVFFPQGVDIDEFNQLSIQNENTNPSQQPATINTPSATADTATTVQSSDDPSSEVMEETSDPNTVNIDFSDESGSSDMQEASNTVSISAKKFRFVPSSVTVKKGEPVTLTLTSEDVEHSFTLPAFNLDVAIPAGESVEVQFTPDISGTFTFSSSSNEAMTGELIVK